MTANRWEVTLNGRIHTVSVERGASGKDVVRIDGRAAGPPFGAEESLRTVAVGAFRYTVRRTGPDEFEMEPAVISADMAAASLAAHDDSALKPAKQVWLLVAGATVVALFGLAVLVGLFDDPAVVRVEKMLADIQRGQDQESHVSRVMWAKGTRLDAQELMWADTHFMQWRQEKGFLSGFTSFRVLDSARMKDAPLPTSLVRFVADGKEYKVRVPERKPMSWAE